MGRGTQPMIVLAGGGQEGVAWTCCILAALSRSDRKACWDKPSVLSDKLLRLMSAVRLCLAGSHHSPIH